MKKVEYQESTFRDTINLAQKMHSIGCGHPHCDYENIWEEEKWKSRYLPACNTVFLEFAQKAQKLMMDNNISEKKFLKAYENWKYDKFVSKKLRRLMNQYDIVDG